MVVNLGFVEHTFHPRSKELFIGLCVEVLTLVQVTITVIPSWSILLGQQGF